MVNSNLRRIIKRLEAMVIDSAGPIQVRTFERYGIAVCDVLYNQESGEFVVKRVMSGELTVFDQLDLAAIEVYDCVEDFRQQF
ncbi:MAG: DUF1797 family protein [Limosilactobacillus gorillae]|uniref:DUF1797 family protein n=1 Tax=Limosilactobacillus gorillae TaxID=1450649 RepID=UPI000ABC3033|nr:DUF1797 family protein [Limosilactobacillus gorillae]MDO4856126.1 DUF1797 family protein [Limosilactobacillus gorillae]